MVVILSILILLTSAVKLLFDLAVKLDLTLPITF